MVVVVVVVVIVVARSAGVLMAQDTATVTAAVVVVVVVVVVVPHLHPQNWFPVQARIKKPPVARERPDFRHNKTCQHLCIQETKCKL